MPHTPPYSQLIDRRHALEGGEVYYVPDMTMVVVLFVECHKVDGGLASELSFVDVVSGVRWAHFLSPSVDRIRQFSLFARHTLGSFNPLTEGWTYEATGGARWDIWLSGYILANPD